MERRPKTTTRYSTYVDYSVTDVVSQLFTGHGMRRMNVRIKEGRGVLPSDERACLDRQGICDTSWLVDASARAKLGIISHRNPSAFVSIVLWGGYFVLLMMLSAFSDRCIKNR